MTVQVAERTMQPVYVLQVAPTPATNALVQVRPSLAETVDLRQALELFETARAACHASCATRGERAFPWDPKPWSIAANWLSFGVIGFGAAYALNDGVALLPGLVGPAAVALGRAVQPAF